MKEESNQRGAYWSTA